ncbi:LysR family transcriptional regulator [Undibacterium squillarum]|uniref:LysR family transcriptional regulator n=1 Tax=Undibacterium squillarum TaxID=1131567 RepID=A0ABQ2XWU7_9BURK|nr:LysR family transcriptional regulator [Undibacterium squillarum]GGX36324.1 LysR family transcriptional regulator [Undibacterium squillarum]
MDRFVQLTAYVAVAEEESFARAARRLNMSAPALTRTIAALEQSLGVKLLNRTTRFVRPTDAGLRYLDDARQILARMQEADDAVVGINAAPRGHLTMTAPVLFGKMFVMPQLVSYLQTYPDMQVSALFLDRVVNMLEEGVEVGVRIGELADSSMRAIRVGSIRRVLCASPQYLAQHGTPQTPADLTHHQIIAATGVGTNAEWKFAHKGEPLSMRVKPRLTVSTNDAAICAVSMHAGIARLLSYQVAQELQQGSLQTVMTDYEPAPWPVHVVHREGRGGSARVRSLVDHLVQGLRQQTALQASD